MCLGLFFWVLREVEAAQTPTNSKPNPNNSHNSQIKKPNHAILPNST